MASLNYAVQYAQALAQAYPYALNFGALYATPNNGRYRVTGARTIEIPTISTSGRVDADRDTIAMATRNYDNAWEPKVLSHQRKWSTLVHPADIDQTNYVASIQNITQVYNEEQKFPEMDAYLISQLYTLWTGQGKTADTTALTVANILSVFDQMMLNMDEARVPVNGRILYVTNAAKSLLKKADGVTRNLDVGKGGRGNSINRVVSRLDEVEIIGVPQELMKTAYDFTKGWKPQDNAAQVNMFLVHPSAVITPVSYEQAQLDPPSAVTEGKYIYFEESFEDVFILNKKVGGLQFHVTPASAQATHTITVSSSVTGGTVTTSPSGTAAAGAQVTVTATPDASHEGGTVTVTKASGGTVTVTGGKFTMPAENVTVSATFTAKSA